MSDERDYWIDDDGTRWFTLPCAARAAGQSRREARQALSELRRLGLIESKVVDGTTVHRPLKPSWEKDE